MERCPNCGSTVRSGAKFCTTCGFRLPEPVATEPVATEPVVGAGVRSPFESTSSVSASRWPTPGAEAASEDGAAATDGSSASESEAADDRAAAVASHKEPTATDDSDAIELGPGNEVPAPNEDASDSGVWWSRSGSTWSSSWRSEEPGTETPAAADSGSGEPRSEETAAEPVVAEDRPPDDGGGDDTASTIVRERTAEAGDIDAPAVVEPSAYADPETLGDDEALGIDLAAEAHVGATEALDQAYRLIEELRALLPSLAAAPEARSSGAEEVAAALETARADADPNEVEALRSALNAARERPRDIEVILDLSGRLDAIGGVLDTHDRYAAAIDEAIAKLRGTVD